MIIFYFPRPSCGHRGNDVYIHVYLSSPMCTLAKSNERVIYNAVPTRVYCGFRAPGWVRRDRGVLLSSVQLYNIGCILARSSLPTHVFYGAPRLLAPFPPLLLLARNRLIIINPLWLAYYLACTYIHV